MSNAAISNALTTAERDTLANLIAVVERGQQTFVEVGNAMRRIRDERLWRASDKTFAAFCERTWGFTDRRARQLMEAAEVVNEVSVESEKSEPVVPVSSERVARELAKAPPAKRAEAMKRASETAEKPDKPTAVEVRRAVAEVTQPLKPLEVQEPVKSPCALDGAGQPIPAALAPSFDCIDAFDQVLGLLTQATTIVTNLGGDGEDRRPVPGGEFLAVYAQDVKRDIRNARQAIKANRPHAVCPYCKGAGKRCEACKGLGYVPHAIYAAAPADLRKGKVA